MKRVRTALFGGSFNPIHWGHIGLAEQVLRDDWADEVWLLVSPQNPLKRSTDLAPEATRLALARRALQGHDRIEASDFEFGLPRPSYTFQTLTALRAQFPERDFRLLIGADNWHIFDRWAHAAEIVATTEILVYPRTGYPIEAETLPATVHLVQAPLFPYSSTDIRAALRRGEDVRKMIPEDIIDDCRTLYAQEEKGE